MDVIHVHRRVLAVHLFGDNNFATNQTGQRQNPTIIVLKPGAEGEVRSRGVLEIFGSGSVNIAFTKSSGAACLTIAITRSLVDCAAST
jgi:hypothetical protein